MTLDPADYARTVHVVTNLFRRKVRPADIDDVRQDAWVGVIKACRTYQPGHDTAPRTWVERKATFAVMDGIRSRDIVRRHLWDPNDPRIGTPYPLNDEAFQVATADDPQLRVDVDDLLTRTLPERERTLVVAAYLLDVPLKDVAAHLGVGQPRVTQLKARALERLRAATRDAA